MYMDFYRVSNTPNVITFLYMTPLLNCREHERQERADNGDRAEHREPQEGLQLHQERPRTRRAQKEEGA